jgi:hypothetical protein
MAKLGLVTSPNWAMTQFEQLVIKLTTTKIEATIFVRH